MKEGGQDMSNLLLGGNSGDEDDHSRSPRLRGLGGGASSASSGNAGGNLPGASTDNMAQQLANLQRLQSQMDQNNPTTMMMLLMTHTMTAMMANMNQSSNAVTAVSPPSFNKKVVHPTIVEDLKKLANTHMKQMLKFSRTSSRIEKLTKDIEDINNDLQAPNIGDPTLPAELTELDEIWNDCKNEVGSILINIPQGTSRRNAARHLIAKAKSVAREIALEAEKEHHGTLRTSSSKQMFLAAADGLKLGDGELKKAGIEDFDKLYITGGPEVKELALKIYDQKVKMVEKSSLMIRNKGEKTQGSRGHREEHWGREAGDTYRFMAGQKTREIQRHFGRRQ